MSSEGKRHRLVVSRGRRRQTEGHIRVPPARVLQSESILDQVQKKKDKVLVALSCLTYLP